MNNAPVTPHGWKRRFIRVILWTFIAGVASACAHQLPVRLEGATALYLASTPETPLVEKYAPAFVAYESDDDFNRIGRPEVFGENGRDTIRVTTELPTVYVATRPFETARGNYTNLYYRVHFPEIPYRLIPFNYSAGDNVGLMVVVTLDSNQRPLLVTTVHTCGCYLAITPTDYLPRDMYPADWAPVPVDVYGETLPARLSYSAFTAPRLVVHLRPSVHRVMDLTTVDAGTMAANLPRPVPMAVRDMAELDALPRPDGGFTSFYYTDGGMKGHVKGAWKPLETLFLGIISLDYAVGTDKAYEDTAVTENPFYTSLKFWNRNASNMWYFDRFLQFWGWRL